jgi:glutamine synthetase
MAITIDSSEGFWNSGREEKPNLGYKTRYKEGYFPVQPMDTSRTSQRNGADPGEIGVKIECTITRLAQPASAKLTCALTV